MAEKTYTTNPFKAPETIQRIKDVAKFTAEASPIIGDGIAIKEIVDEVNKKDTNWFLVGALGGATILGLIPGVGDAAARLVKKGAKRAFDVSKRIEIDLNVLGSTGGNIKIKPEDIADVQAKKIQKILKNEKNVNDNFYMLHGGTDFDKMDLKASGLGEPGSFRPLGRGIYGSRIVDPKNIETIKNAYLQASRFAGRFGTSITGNYAGFSHPLYKQAFKDANIPIEATESLLKELQEKVPIEVTTEQVGKIHLFKVPRTKDLKVYDFKNRKGISQNTENVKITYPREFSSRFTIASPKFGDSQVVLQPLGEVEEMAIHDTNIVERLTKLDLPEEFFENINKRKLRKNELDPNYPYESIVNKKLENLKKEAQYITDRENLDPKTMEINLLKDLQNKGYIDEDVENLVNQEDFLKEMQEDIAEGRRNISVPEDRLELGEDSTQLLGLDSGKRIPKRTVEYNQGGLPKDKKLTSNPFKAPETLKRLKTALRNAPVIGTVADVVDIGKDLVTGDYAGAAVATGTALAGITPIGRIASKGAKVVGQKAKDIWSYPKQLYDSAATSINQRLNPQGYNTLKKRGDIKKGQTIVDIGGGKFDNVVNDAAKEGATVKVYDPFNRSPQHNKKVVEEVRDGKADVAMSHNVLNVIKEDENIINIVKQAENAIKPNGKAHFSVYAGSVTDRAKGARETSKGWQRFQTIDEYVPFVEKVFGKNNVTVKNSIITATKQPQTTIKSFKSPKGTTFKRGGKSGGLEFPVGKVIGNQVYFHKEYLKVQPKEVQDLYNKSVKKLPTDHKFNTLMYEPSKGDKPARIRFDESADFDTAREPTPGRTISINSKGDIKETNVSQIFHHKWQWVDDNYKGFNVNKEYEWSKEWTSKVDNFSTIGKKENWDKILKEKNLPVDKSSFNQGGLTIEEQTQQAFNQGGINMEQQMSLFDEGGMKDDGLDRDPVSGNEIPPGSLAKEVRDDIPAQLSEGEYVVPADVVQYYGVKFFEDLRMEAKRGLAEMEATGRIGGEPMSMTMIAIGGAEEEQKERQKKALGGIIKADEGVLAKDMSNIEKYRSFNPYNFSVVGGTPFSPIAQTGQSMGLTTVDTHSKMFYHPDGRVQAVPGRMVTVNGEQKFLPNPQYIEFTTGEWSDTPPSQAKAQTTETPKEDRDDRGKSSFDFEAQRLQNENSLKVSAERLGLDPKVFAGLGFFTRFKLFGEEIKAMKGQKIDKDKINSIVSEDGKGSPFDLKSMLKTVTTLGFLSTGNPFIPIAARIIGGFLIGDDDEVKKKDVKSTTKDFEISEGVKSKSIVPTGSSGVDTSTIEGITKASGVTPKTTAKTKTPSAKAKETFREKEAKGLTKSIGTAGGSKTAKDFEDPSDNFAGMINKGGLINKPKRNPKKPRGKGLGSK